MVMSPRSQEPRARRELASAWSAAGLAVIAVAGIFLVSDPDSGREGLIWVLAPAMFLTSVAAGWLGVRARRDGEESGRWPAMIGFAIVGFYALAMLAALVGHLLGFE